MLLQEGHPLAFVIKALGPRTRGLSTYEKEYLAVLMAVEQWCAYLQHGEFIIFTDQRSLVHITDQHLHTPWQLKLYTKLVACSTRLSTNLGLQIKRLTPCLVTRNLQLSYAISTSTLAWLANVVSGYDRDPSTLKLIQELSLAPDSRPPYTLTDGVLRLHDRIWIGSNTKLQHRLTTALHTSVVGGHSGFPVTFSKLKKLFVWRGMKSNVKLHRLMFGVRTGEAGPCSLPRLTCPSVGTDRVVASDLHGLY